LIHKAYPSREQSGTTFGVDLGATLTKLAIRLPDGRTSFRSIPTDAIERVAQEVESIVPRRLGLTGGGAPELARLLGLDTAPIGEFDAWRAGAEALLRRQGLAAEERYLLVSLGTGTSAMLVEGGRALRVGGTALGGGTVLGLGAALTGTRSFDELAALAARGDRRKVDLLVSEIYRSGELPLPGDVNAASFAKLADPPAGRPPEASDLAHAVMGLVGENVALICHGLAVATDARRIVFGGATLRSNAALVGILKGLGAALGVDVVILADGEFAGAVGALELGAGDAGE